MKTSEKILEFLRQGGFVSGQEISNKLNISRNGVNKQIKALREKGYVIESYTNRGYRLLSEPDSISVDIIDKALTTLYIGRPTVLMEKVDSTNEELKRRARSGAAQGFTLVAEEQTFGKGRFGRSWRSPRGASIYESILLRPEISASNIPCVTLAAGLAVCKAVNGLYDCGTKIKWPNDVIIGNKKICGILTEMTAEDNAVSYAVVGIGINVNNYDFPQEIEEKATSILIETGVQHERNELIAAVAQEFEKIYNEFVLCGFGALKDEYIKNCATIGRDVSAYLSRDIVTGEAVDVEADGGLIILTEDGERVHVSTGEVTVQGIY